jgi:hypothetical protein
MVAMVLIGMSSLWWGVILGIVVSSTSSRLRCACEMSWSFRSLSWLSAWLTSEWLETNSRSYELRPMIE